VCVAKTCKEEEEEEEEVEVGMERGYEIWLLILTCIPNHEEYTLFGITSLIHMS
jgi:hypothetical protein